MSDNQDTFLEDLISEDSDAPKRREERPNDTRIGEDVVVRKDFDSPALNQTPEDVTFDPATGATEDDGAPAKTPAGDEPDSEFVIFTTDPADGSDNSNDNTPQDQQPSEDVEQPVDQSAPELADLPDRQASPESRNVSAQDAAAGSNDTSEVEQNESPAPPVTPADDGSGDVDGGGSGQAPTDISVAGGAVDENAGTGTVVGTLSTLD